MDGAGVDIPAVVVEEDVNEKKEDERGRHSGRKSFSAWQRYYEQRQRVCYRVRSGPWGVQGVRD